MKKPNSLFAAPAALAVVTAILLFPSPANAATITWGAPTTISGGGDVSTAGTLFDAASNGGTGVPSTTVSGVTFAPFVTNGSGLAFADTSGKMTLTVSSGSVSGGSNFGGGAPFSNLSPAAYQTLLSSASTSFNTLAMTLTINSLTIGNSYQVELWANYSDITAAAPLGETVTAGNSTPLIYNTTNLVGGVGQYVIGTFMATASTQQIQLTGSGNMAFPGALLNAVEVRSLAVPEPSIPGLMISGAACLLAVRRFRSKFNR
jgi:hypothetical protein